MAHVYSDSLKLGQLKWEIGVMQRTLYFIRDENIHFKTRLCEMLVTSFNNNQLDHIETFQNRFIMLDELIAMLMKQINEVNKSIANGTSEVKEPVERINTMVSRVAANIDLAEERFKKLKLEFNSYLFKNI